MTKNVTDYMNLKKEIISAEDFKNSCRQILSVLADYDLNQLDKFHTFTNILKGNSNFTKNPTLYESGCLNEEEFKIIEQMGINLSLKKELLKSQILIN